MMTRKKKFYCFACKKKRVRKHGAFCKSCRKELKNMRNGAF